MTDDSCPSQALGQDHDEEAGQESAQAALAEGQETRVRLGYHVARLLVAQGGYDDTMNTTP